MGSSACRSISSSPLDDEEELVLVVVLGPVEVALDDAQAVTASVDRDERLVEPRLVRRGLVGDVDQLEMAERVAVAEFDVPDAGIEVRERSARLRLDHGGFDVVAGERADRVHRLPAGDDDDLDAPVCLHPLDRRVDEPVCGLERRSHRIGEVQLVRVGARGIGSPTSPATRDHGLMMSAGIARDRRIPARERF